MSRISKRIVDAAKPNGRDYFLWDDALAGFGLRVFASGHKTYVLQYKRDGRTRRISLGAHGVLTPEKARLKARIALGEIADGKNPAEQRRMKSSDPNISELCDVYLDEGPQAKPQKKSSSWATDKSNINRHIKPLLGLKKLRSLTKRDIERFQADVTAGKSATTEKTKKRGKAVVRGGPGTAWRATVVLSALLTFAVERGLRADNPARGVQLNKLQSRTRFLTTDEMKKLGEVLAAESQDVSNTWIVAAIRLLMLTGCRKSEILKLEWTFVDFEGGFLRLPDSKTGAKVVPIGQAAIDLLMHVPRLEGSKYVLPSTVGDGPLVGLQKAWERIRAKAKIEEVRLHDLRHTFASVAVSSGESLYTVASLMGHSHTRTTQIYAHLSKTTVKATANRVAELMSGSLSR